MKNPFLGAPASATRQKEHSIHATSKVRAILRIRPFLPLEKETESASAIRITGKNSAEIVNLRNASEALTFTFDGCYEPEVSNLALFRSQIKPMLSSLLSGINMTVFAYGNTGAGKTFTMEGTPSSPGLIPLALQELFNSASSPDVIFKVSFLEIYNEKVYDLLTGSGLDLQIREDQNKNIFISNLMSVRICSFEDFASHWETARRHRRSASTKLNPNSSRSHSCLTLSVESGIQGAGWHSPRRRARRLAKLHLIDLAGSEDNRKTENMGMRMVESGSINKSLFVLSNVVDALNAGSPRIPYRDSKLTRLLQVFRFEQLMWQDSLGGCSNALIVANVSPSTKHLAETTHTLNFASKSRQIINNPMVNEMPQKNDHKCRRPSPLVSGQHMVSPISTIKSNWELSQRVAILEAKLNATAMNITMGKKNQKTSLKQVDHAESPLKPVKRRRQNEVFDGDFEAEEKSIAALLWGSIQERLKSGSGSENLMDEYILLLANSGSTSLVKRLPGIGEKRANAIIDARMMGNGSYSTIFEMENRCNFKPKLFSSIRQALLVQALYGTNDRETKVENKENKENIRNL